MATIKAIEGRTVHQIQSGQVIVDLCSVVKELVENSLDAGATSVEVRFKGNGLESIEVQDNGTGIPTENYATIALKHYTSKLSTYDDLSSLRTFGFRGEALSSLCALSTFHLVTAQADEAPKGTRLDFETSGKLKATSVVASQKGTTVTVEGLFTNLPVRRRELEKNIKREYGKVLGLLQAYSCISTSVKFCVSNVMAKGKKVVVFVTKSNATTRENIANVFGAKTLPALVQMDLSFTMQTSRSTIASADQEDSQGRVSGHVSRPVFGEGRQTPDRQMFFVNARPCSLPQFAKVFNEVYKSYNVSQSPFVFANIILDTNAYDVNVSPDKRTILLHDQTALLESLRGSLIELFEKQDQTIPQTQRLQQKLPSFKQLTVQRQDPDSADAGFLDSHKRQTESLPDSGAEDTGDDPSIVSAQYLQQTPSLIGQFAGRDAQPRVSTKDEVAKRNATLSNGKQKLVRKLGDLARRLSEDRNDVGVSAEIDTIEEDVDSPPNAVTDFNKRIAEQQTAVPMIDTLHPKASDPEGRTDGEDNVPRVEHTPTKPALGVVQNAFDRMRPRRQSLQVATITIATKTRTAILGSTPSRQESRSLIPPSQPAVSRHDGNANDGGFSSTMQAFRAPGSTLAATPLTVTQARSSAAAPVQEPFDAAPSVNRPPSAADFSDGEGSDSEVSQGQDAVDSDQGVDNTDDENDRPNMSGSDNEYLDEEGRKAKEDAGVADLIQQAEEKAAVPSPDNMKRASKILLGRGLKDSTTQLLQTLHASVDSIRYQLRTVERELQQSMEQSLQTQKPAHFEEVDAEEKLSLTVTKEDFSRMIIIGQFNLGFILAIRPSISPTTDDELFIIDQHASDEKFNFERLRASTTVRNQRLVRPKLLDLTAIEEEIIIENNGALVENGFIVEIDQSGDLPVGQRCKLIALPMSKEVTFDLSDLEELIVLLGDSPSSTAAPITPNALSRLRYIPRPSKVRKLFAMRACRSSVMIGKTLQRRQMEKLVRHMGEIDKPWNCPHGRPTMRHVIGLRDWEGWREGEGLVGMGENMDGAIDWKEWMKRRRDERIVAGGDEEEVGSVLRGEQELEGADDPTVEVSEDDLLDEDDEDDRGEADEEGGSDGERARQSLSQRFLFS